MAEVTAESGSENVVIEDVGPSRKKLTITVPASRVSEQIETSLETLAVEANIPGFRKGHVPRKVVERRFGTMIRDEAKSQLVSTAYSEAVEAHGLKVLGEPEGHDSIEGMEVDPSQDMTFSLEVEVAPEFELPSLDGIEVTKPVAEVPDDMVEREIEHLCQNDGELEPQEEAGPGDFCIGNGKITDEEGEEHLTLEGAVIQIAKEKGDGSGSILGVLVKDFTKQVGSPKPGQTLEVKTKGPENHENPDLRGKKLNITFDVQQVQRIVPAKIEDVVTRLGVADEKQLRETITLQLNQRAVIEQQSAMREQIAQHLLDSVEIDLPESLTQSQVERNMQRERMDMMYRGVDPMRIEQRMAEIRDRSQEAARRELKLFFILARVAEDLKVQVTEEEVRGRVAQIAAERNMRPQDLYDQLVQQNQFPQVAQQIREHKAIDEILSRAKVTDESGG